MQSCVPRLTHTNMSVVNNMKAAVTVRILVSCHGVATLMDFIDGVSDCWKIVSMAVTVCLGGNFSF